MQKKLFAALMALAAFAAFAVSATSASATTLTFPTGTALATGNTLLGTNVGKTLMTNNSGGIVVECSTAKMTGTLKTNSGGSVAGDITASTFTGCTSPINGSSVTVTTSIAGGLPYCLKNTKEDNFEIRGGLCSETARPIKYTLDLTNSTCGYEVASLTGTFKTHPEDALMSVTKAGPFKRYELTGIESLLCPSEATLDMTFTLEKDNEKTAEPVYFS